MKPKKMTGLLILAVTAIWGIIIYRVVQASAGDDENLRFGTAQQTLKQPVTLPELADTFRLALNYRDPFTGKPAAPESPVAQQQVQAPARTALQPPVKVITYSGYIVNPSTRKIVSIITIDNKETMVSEGETVSGLTLIKNMKDAIRVRYQGEIRTININ